ncbi:MAG TPA: hypothetical protein VNC21_01950, partial [Vicinamibacterales bacterium]|nr:hypothetical protein [Vicinamibacterales bacterium]
MLRDVRFTVRNMARSPGLAVVIAVSLALGIGANTAIFSLIHAVMLKRASRSRSPIASSSSTGMARRGRAVSIKAAAAVPQIPPTRARAVRR